MVVTGRSVDIVVGLDVAVFFNSMCFYVSQICSETYSARASLSSKSSASEEICLDRLTYSSVLRAPALLCESNYSCIRIRRYVLIVLLCNRLVDMDIGKDGLGKMCLAMLMKIWFLWKILSSYTYLI